MLLRSCTDSNICVLYRKYSYLNKYFSYFRNRENIEIIKAKFRLF